MSNIYDMFSVKGKNAVITGGAGVLGSGIALGLGRAGANIIITDIGPTDAIVAKAKEEGIKVRKGIYVGSSGPTLETPAEYRLFRAIGGDATGMSTVPEAVVAHHMGIKVFGMSVITNGSEPADPEGETTHDEVQNVAGAVEPKMTTIITKLIEKL